MKLFKIKWLENSNIRTKIVLVKSAETLLLDLDGFKVTNLISIYKIDTNDIEVVTLEKLNKL